MEKISTISSMVAGLGVGILLTVFGTSYMLGWTKPKTLVERMEKQCDKEKIAKERQYDCPVSLNAVLHYKDGSHTLEWLQDDTHKKE